MTSDLPIVFRPITPNDYGYILASWSREYHKVMPFNFIPNSIYVPHQTSIIQKCINTSNVIVAHLDDSPDDIVGYIVWQQYNDSNIIVHWANVKAIYRRFGVMKEILNFINIKDKNIIMSHYFKLFPKLKDKYCLVYDPTILEN